MKYRSLDEDVFSKTGVVAYYDDKSYINIVDSIKEVLNIETFPYCFGMDSLRLSAVKAATIVGISHEEDRNHPAASVTLKKAYSVNKEDIFQFFRTGFQMIIN